MTFISIAIISLALIMVLFIENLLPVGRALAMIKSKQ